MKYRWTIAPPQTALVAVLARELNTSPLLAQCLLNRGLSEPEPITRFLQPRLKNLADPFLLPNMRAAVERLEIDAWREVDRHRTLRLLQLQPLDRERERLDGHVVARGVQ